MKRWTMAFLLLPALACGVKRPPQPPETHAPVATSTASVER